MTTETKELNDTLLIELAEIKQEIMQGDTFVRMYDFAKRIDFHLINRFYNPLFLLEEMRLFLEGKPSKHIPAIDDNSQKMLFVGSFDGESFSIEVSALQLAAVRQSLVREKRLTNTTTK